MVTSSDIVRVGPLEARLGSVAAFLYLQGEDIDLERCAVFLRGLGDLLTNLVSLPDPTKEDIQFEFYEAAKRTFGDNKGSIREFFQLIYQLILMSPSGPRLGEFVEILGVDRFIAVLEARFIKPLV